MMTTRVMAVVWLMVVVPLVVVGCQWGIGARVAPTPIPPAAPMLPATPSPPQPATVGMANSDQKLVDGHLHVEYLPPCALMAAPAEWVAPIKLTDLRYGSVVYLNRNGTIKDSPKPKSTEAADRVRSDRR